MLSGILGIVVVIILGSVMCYFANMQGHYQFLMAIASFLFILVLVIKDFIEKMRKRKEDDAKSSRSGRSSRSSSSKSSSKKPSKGSISDIAHRSTKDK